MEQLSEAKNILSQHKKIFPNSKKYPQKFWDLVILLSKKFDTPFLAREFGIDSCHISRRIRGIESRALKSNSSVSFVETSYVPHPKQMTIELPNNITLRIDL